MLKRRDIREAAIQFLYLADLEDGPEASDMHEAFWQMVQENSLKKLNLAKTKAILHVTQGREDRIAKLNELASSAHVGLAAGSDTGEMAVSLKHLIAQENELSEQIEALKSGARNQKGEPVPDHLIQAVMDANLSLTEARAIWHQHLSSHPECAVTLEQLNANLNRLERASQRLASLEDPDSTIGSFAHLHATSSELEAFRRETQALVTHVLQRKEDIDRSLAAVIENYAPQRVDPVDRAILRLATYELQMSDDIPRVVTINEAIEIAKKYGTADSARFVNGVLDALQA